MMDPKDLKALARQELGGVPGVQGFGIGDGALLVYLLNAGSKDAIPSRFHGVEVRCVVEGDIQKREERCGVRLVRRILGCIETATIFGVLGVMLALFSCWAATGDGDSPLAAWVGGSIGVVLGVLAWQKRGRPGVFER